MAFSMRDTNDTLRLGDDEKYGRLSNPHGILSSMTTNFHRSSTHNLITYIPYSN